MNATAPANAPARVSSADIIKRSAAAEWTRLATMRSTWWCVLAATAMMLAIATAAGLQHDDVGSAPVWVPAQLAIVPAQFAFLLLVVLAVTGEYATGAIRSTLQWVPRREILFATRLLVTVTAAVAFTVAAASVSNLLAWALVGDAAEVVAGDIVASLGRIALVVAFGGVLAVGIGLLSRSTAGTLTALFLLVLALPIALGNTGIDSLVAIGDATPGRAIVSLVVIGQDALPPREIAWVMTTWSAAALLAGSWSLMGRDTV